MNAIATEVPQEARSVQETNGADRNYITPDVNIFETKDGYILEAELPGVSKDNLEITVEGDELTLLGRRDGAETKAQFLHRESTPADYRRVFELDPAIDVGKINAVIEQGILTLRLPKSEQSKPRKVTVNG